MCIRDRHLSSFTIFIYQIEKNMESQKPKVAMYVKRSFGDKLNASFDFIKENWKILFKFTTYLLLPVSLIQALSLNGLMGGAFAMTAMSKTATVQMCIRDSLKFTVNHDGNIRFGLGAVKGVGEAAVQSIVEERNTNGPFKGIFDFVQRVNLNACNKKNMECLALSLIHIWNGG